MEEIAKVFVRIWAVCVGRSEDGEDIIADVFNVVAEAADGSRVVHFHAFPSGDWVNTPAGQAFARHSEGEVRARALADRVSAHLEAGGRLNPDHWAPTEPAYGSEAWRRDAAFLAARERSGPTI